MKTKKRIALGLLCATLFAGTCALPARAGDAPLISPLPLAQNAKPKPDETPEQREGRQLQELNVQMNVLIGSHDYDRIDKITQGLLGRYRAKTMSANDYFNSLAAIAPRQAGKGMVEDLLAWTRARPNSYFAWYALGVQYAAIAGTERGNKYAGETTDAQFAAMAKYAALSRAAFLRSLNLGAEAAPTYSQMIRLGEQSPYRGVGTMGMIRQMILPPAQPEHYCPAKGSSVTEFPTRVDEGLYYLCLSLKHDPEATLPFENFVTFNSPRWGGSFEMLDSLEADIERTAAECVPPCCINDRETPMPSRKTPTSPRGLPCRPSTPHPSLNT